MASLCWSGIFEPGFDGISTDMKVGVDRNKPGSVEDIAEYFGTYEWELILRP